MESDREFLERMSEWEDGTPCAKASWSRLLSLAARGAATQWRPIEEEPESLKDGERALLLTFDGTLVADWWRDAWRDEAGEPVHFITHFILLTALGEPDGTG